MEQLRIFDKKEFGKIRTVEIKKEAWFIGTDVAKLLGYKRPNDAINQHCRHTVKHRICDSQGVKHNYRIIPESDIYRLIINSKLPKAEQFEKWLFEEVTPIMEKFK